MWSGAINVSSGCILLCSSIHLDHTCVIDLAVKQSRVRLARQLQLFARRVGKLLRICESFEGAAFQQRAVDLRAQLTDIHATLRGCESNSKILGF